MYEIQEFQDGLWEVVGTADTLADGKADAGMRRAYAFQGAQFRVVSTF